MSNEIYYLSFANTPQFNFPPLKTGVRTSLDLKDFFFNFERWLGLSRWRPCLSHQVVFKRNVSTPQQLRTTGIRLGNIELLVMFKCTHWRPQISRKVCFPSLYDLTFSQILGMRIFDVTLASCNFWGLMLDVVYVCSFYSSLSLTDME